MSLHALNDESIARYHESLRKEVEMDKKSMKNGGHEGFASGNSARQYGAALEAEMRRRAMQFCPIEW